MDTTTSDGGATAQPETIEAVTTGYNADQVITTDNNGTPSLEPVTSQSDSAEAAPEAEPQAPAEEAQAPATEESAPADDFDAESYAKKKGITLDDPKKLAKMAADAEKKMHEATAKARELERTTAAQVPLGYTGDPNFDVLAREVNTMRAEKNVQDFFGARPEAREYESKMAELVLERPHLRNDLDALYALAKTDPSREAELKQQGGREEIGRASCRERV